MSDPHNCPGLAECIDHPKWSVLFADLGRWEALAPGPEYDSRSRFFLTSHAVAINYAQKQARKVTR